MATWVRIGCLMGLLVATGTLGCAGKAQDAEITEEEDALRAKLVGSWRVVPPDAELRELKVVQAAMSGHPGKKKELGTLSKDELAAFDRWAATRGSEADNMKAQLRFLEGARFEFAEDQVTVRFGTNAYGPVDFMVEEAEARKSVLRFDPGLGNGMETHSIRWSGDDEGVDRISSDKRGSFEPLQIQRR